MNCQRVSRSLTDYLDAALSPVRRQGIDRHVRSCRACRAELAELQCLGRQLRSLPKPVASPATANRLLAALRKRRPFD